MQKLLPKILLIHNKMTNSNIEFIKNEIDWLSKIIELRFLLFLNKETHIKSIFDISPPKVSPYESIYANIITSNKLGFVERLAIILTLAPHIQNQLLDIFFTIDSRYNRRYSEFGGIMGKSFSGFIPTGETLAFIIGQNDYKKKFEILKLFESSHIFASSNILHLQSTEDYEPKLSGALSLSTHYYSLFIYGIEIKPDFSSKFPAKLIETKLDWKDLIVENSVHSDIKDIILWIKHKEKLLREWDLEETIKPGYRALFYGPPGTGKTFAASLIGKNVNKDVYKIDLSMVVSKWVGETEKNLARVFDTAEDRDWILFFDEADALFGKRTSTQSSQERYANQEVAYLLQRTENYPGTVILASNLKGNMDNAFTRRFQSIVYFPIPKPNERFRMWQHYFNKTLALHDEINLKQIANKYEISGGGVVNVIKFCVIRAAERNEKLVILDDLEEGIRKELLKEGRIV